MPLGVVVEQVSCLCSLHVPRATTAGHLGPVLPDCGNHPAGDRTCLHSYFKCEVIFKQQLPPTDNLFI